MSSWPTDDYRRDDMLLQKAEKKREDEKNRIGKRFGKWKVLRLHKIIRYKSKKRISKTSSPIKIYECECECGVIKPVRLGDLLSGASTKCLQCRYDSRKRYSGLNYFWSIFNANAKNRGYKVNVTKKFIFDLLKKQNYRCALTGWSIKIAESVTEAHNRQTTASIDRIDSSIKSYTEGNIQWVHKDVNRIKLDFAKDRFIEICIAVASYNTK